MRGNIGFARIAGIVALGGAFYTATYITSYPGGAPGYAVFGLLAGTVAGILALAVPSSPSALTVAAVLLGIAFTGAVIDSGVAFGPGFVLMIMAARRAARPDDFAWLEEGRSGPETTEHYGITVASTGSFRERAAAPDVVVIPDAQALAATDGRVVVVPEADPVVVVPDAERPAAGNGLVQAGPPGVIGLLGPARRGRQSGGFRPA